MASRTYYSEDARKRAQKERSFIAALSLAVGVAIGTVIALLFAPEDGESLRNTLSDATTDLIDDAEEKAKQLAS